MVQQSNLPLQHPSREIYSPRDNCWHSNDSRSFLDISEGRFQPSQHQSLHPRALPVEASLRDCAGLSVREFALFVVDENGEEKEYSSSFLTPYQQRIFSEQFRLDFRKAVRKANKSLNHRSARIEIDPEGDSRQHYSGHSSSDDRRKYSRPSSDDSDEDNSGSARRKRSKPSLFGNDDNSAPVPTQKTMQLMIGDEVEVKKFYCQRFKDMQQSSCKVIGKAFVKAVEPKKQTHHPYTKGDAAAPSWWPLKGTMEERARHKEPDHLLKPERIALLVHILRMVIEPAATQHPSVQKLGLNVKKLEEATMEMMTPWFNEQGHPENASKKPYFKEIFKVARAEERYRNGEIDANTRIHVIHGERSNDQSDDDEAEEVAQDGEDEHETHPSSASTTMSPDMVSPSIGQGPLPHPESDAVFRHRVRVGGYHTAPQMEDHSSYPDSQYMPRTVGVGFQSLSPGPLQEPLRRPFQSAGYQSPQQGIYGWSQTPIVTQPPSNFYVNSPHSTLPAHSGAYQLPPPPSLQHMLPAPMHHPFDASNNRGFDSGPTLTSQLRTGSIGNPSHMPQHHVFPEYIHDHGQTETEMKDEHMYSSQ